MIQNCTIISKGKKLKNFISIIILGSLFALSGCSSNKTLSLSDKEQSCNNNNSKQCSYVADYYMKKKDYRKAIKYAEIGCINNQAKACEVLGIVYLDGNTVKKDIKKGLELLEKSCSLGDGEVGCSDLAVRYSVQ